VSISSWDNFIAAARNRVPYTKTAAATTSAGNWFSMFNLAGAPGAGTLAIGNTANGVVPTDATAGYPIINSFAVGATGYFARAMISNTVSSRVRFYDRVFAAGAYAFNASTGLASQPSYSGRVPSGPDYTGLEMWAEQVTAATGVQTVQLTYTNQSGTTARSTGGVTQGIQGTVGRMWQLNYQAGDSGVQKIESVVGTIATAGTFNVMVLRPIFDAYVSTANEGRFYGPDVTNLIRCFEDMAIFAMVMAPAGTTSGLPSCDLDIISG
jgi:hypothetical protein